MGNLGEDIEIQCFHYNIVVIIRGNLITKKFFKKGRKTYEI